jgi:hypothetical protein
MKYPGRFPCLSDREGSQSERLGYGFFHKTRREVSIDFQDLSIKINLVADVLSMMCVQRILPAKGIRI